MRAAHEAQVMPPIASPIWLPLAGAGGVMRSVAVLICLFPQVLNRIGASVAVAVGDVPLRAVPGAGAAGCPGAGAGAHGDLGGAHGVVVPKVQEQPVVPGRGGGGVEGDVRAGS